MIDVTSLVLSYIIKIWFVIDLIILTIGIYYKIENEIFVKESKCLKEFENIKKIAKEKYKKLNFCMKFSILLMISMIVIFVIAIFWTVFSLGGIMYLEAGISGRNAYKFFMDFAFYTPFMIGILFDILLALFSYKLIHIHVNIRRELKNLF